MTSKLTRLEEVAISNFESRTKMLQHENYSFERAAYSQTRSNWTNAWNAYLNYNEIEKAKTIFNESGFIDLKRIELFKHRVLDMQNPRDNLACVALSDNTQLIEKYSEVDYEITYISRDKPVTISFRDYAKKGELVAIYSLSILNVLKKELDELHKTLDAFQKTITSSKAASILLPDFEFLKSLLSKDKDLIKSKIELFLMKKLHKQRMRDEILLDELISLPAILYLKLSWILGFQIEITSPLIPMDLMPIKPLDKYQDTCLELIK